MKTRNRLYHILFVLPLFVIISQAVWAEEIPKIASIPLRVETSELHKLWFDALKLLDNQEFNDAQLKLTEVDLEKAASGLKNLPLYSAVLIKRANALKQQGQLPEAIKLIESAEQLSPDFAGVYFAKAKYRFAQKMTDVYGVGRDFLQGLLLMFKDIHPLVVYTNNGLIFLLVSGSITGAIFILFSFIYYRRAIFFSLKEALPLPLPLFIANILGWIVVGAVTLGFGIYWGVLFLALLLIPQIEPRSKPVLQIFLFFGGLTTILLIAVSITFMVFNGEYFVALRALSYGNYSTRTVNALQKHLQENPNDGYAMFGLAYIASHVGNSQDAIETYQEIPGQYPDRAAVQNNLGNLYHLQFRQTQTEQETERQTLYQNAEDAYRSAIGYSGRMFEARYNIGQLLLANFTRSEDAQGQLAVARQLDLNRFTRYSGYLEEGIVTVDAPLATLAILKKLYGQESINAGLVLAKKLWASGSRFDNPWYFLIGSIVLLVISSFWGKKKGAPQQGVYYCQMCGEPYRVKKRRKKSEDQKTTLCTQCTYIFKKKTTVKPEKRAEKVKQIELRQKIRGLIAKISSLVIPGSGQIYFGYIVKGILIAFLFYLALAVLLLKIYTRLLPETEGSSGSSVITLGIMIGLLAGTYLFNLYDIRKLSPKNQ